MKLAARALLAHLCVLAAALGQEDAACLKCHASHAELGKARTRKDRALEHLFLDQKKLAVSVHASQSCADCHDGFDRHPHPREAETVGCAECHEEAAKAFETSIHGAPREGRGDLPVSCASCHGVHDVLKARERESRLHPLNVTRTCGACHFDIDASRATAAEILKEPYSDDTHARGILRRGLSVSATCVSCHGGHEIRGQGDPASKVSRLNVQGTCAACHVGIAEEYAGSVHFEKLQADGHKGPTCSDCHRPHDVAALVNGNGLALSRACGKCHQERLGTFSKTYHGKVTALGFGGKVADCAACHGSHEIRAADDPRSPIHPQNITATCAQCHKDANESFAGYLVHADADDAEKYPWLHAIQRMMVWLLLGTFCAAGIHAVLWLIRSFAAGEHRHKRPAGKHYIRRWRQFYVILHVTFMTSFTILAATGIPLHYATEGWAARIMQMIGGTEAAGALHRTAATIMLGCIAAYLGNIGYRFAVKREKGIFWGPNSMVPRWKDFQDAAGNVRWFLFLGKKPRFDRWTYWEKFDFWAVFWGVVIIGGSGVLLWFPEAATRILPGWMLNVAVIVHGHEALLAVGFIFTIHIFHANLRPEKFPMDTLFYTGRMTEEEFKEERPVEYERALEQGTLESLRDSRPRRRTRRRAYIVGTLAIVVGVSLTVLMILAAVG